MKLLQALGNNVETTRKKGQWMARCPVHGDKDFAMRIKENAQGGLSICCYSCGANGLDVYRHLKLDLRELFGKRAARPAHWVPAKVRDIYMEDQTLMAIFRADVAKGVEPTTADARRMRLAERRTRALKNQYPKLKNPSLRDPNL